MSRNIMCVRRCVVSRHSSFHVPCNPNSVHPPVHPYPYLESSHSKTLSSNSVWPYSVLYSCTSSHRVQMEIRNISYILVVTKFLYRFGFGCPARYQPSPSSSTSWNNFSILFLLFLPPNTISHSVGNWCDHGFSFEVKLLKAYINSVALDYVKSRFMIYE